MRKKSLLGKLKMLLSIASKYCAQHNASIAAMEMLYLSRCPGDVGPSGHTSIMISITPCGSLYQVCQQYYRWNELQRERSWVASYGWHSNGHLMEIGGYRYCIFDPVQKQLYLEYYDDEASEKKVETYTAI